MSLPRGVTYWNIARLFKCGYSMAGLAKRFKCDYWEIEAAIRAVMQRAKVRI